MRVLPPLLGLSVAGLIACGGIVLMLQQTGWPFMGGGVLAGASLFYIRLKARFFYGVLEVLFALVLLWSVRNTGKGDFSADFDNDFARFVLSDIVIASGGALYVLIRGLDNVHQGWEQLRNLLGCANKAETAARKL
ncbi:MAG: hypothetical protein ACRYGM_05205 [Janthinobacterium lividum]